MKVEGFHPVCSLYVSGDYEAAIREHQQELSLSEVLNDVIGRAVANRKIGECYAEMGNIEAALKVSRLCCVLQTPALSMENLLCICITIYLLYSSTISSCVGLLWFLLQHQRCHLNLARSVRDHAEEQRALATIGRTYLFRYESDQSRNSLEQAQDAFRQSLAIVDDRLEGECLACGCIEFE